MINAITSCDGIAFSSLIRIPHLTLRLLLPHSRLSFFVSCHWPRRPMPTTSIHRASDGRFQVRRILNVRTNTSSGLFLLNVRCRQRASRRHFRCRQRASRRHFCCRCFRCRQRASRRPVLAIVIQHRASHFCGISNMRTYTSSCLFLLDF